MGRLLSLEDPGARDPRVAGAKAAGLARAKAAGLPVLPGWVVPVDVASRATRTGVDALARRGPAAAVLAATGATIEEEVARALPDVVRSMGGSAIVRSSTAVDADPRWAGAFATYQDVGPEDVVAAVRGCWASAFTRDVLGRCDAMGVEPGTIGIAVLIQPWIRFDARGTAVVHDDGGVRIETLPTTGTPHAAGPREAHSTAVAEIARSALRATGESAIEWGRAADRLVLLQVRTAPAARGSGGSEASRWRARPPIDGGAGARGSARRPERSFPPIAERLAELAASFPGPLGDAWVLPWAPTLEAAPVAPAIEVEDPPAVVAAAAGLAAELTAQAWGDPAEAAGTIRAALGPSPDRSLDRLARLRPVDGRAVRRLVGLVRGMERVLRRRGAIGASESVWRLTPHELAEAAGGDGAARPRRLGPDRWEPFVHAVASGNGRRFAGDAAAGGVGAGRLRILRGPDARWTLRPREVLVATDALAQVAPFLWNAAGLVTSNGAVGAHLFEVARSLGVPAVVGIDVPDDADGRPAAVDGDAGTLSILESAAPARRWA